MKQNATKKKMFSYLKDGENYAVFLKQGHE